MTHKPHLFHHLLHLLVGPQHFLGLMEPQLQPSDLWWEMPSGTHPKTGQGPAQEENRTRARAAPRGSLYLLQVLV